MMIRLPLWSLEVYSHLQNSWNSHHKNKQTGFLYLGKDHLLTQRQQPRSLSFRYSLLQKSRPLHTTLPFWLQLSFLLFLWLGQVLPTSWLTSCIYLLEHWDKTILCNFKLKYTMSLAWGAWLRLQVNVITSCQGVILYSWVAHVLLGSPCLIHDYSHPWRSWAWTKHLFGLVAWAVWARVKRIMQIELTALESSIHDTYVFSTSKSDFFFIRLSGWLFWSKGYLNEGERASCHWVTRWSFPWVQNPVCLFLWCKFHKFCKWL